MKGKDIIIIKGTKWVKRWIKPHKVKGYYRMMKINVNVCFKKKKEETKE